MENNQPSQFPEFNTIIEKYSPFLKEIRKRIILTSCVFAASTIVGFLFYENIIRFLIEILSLKGINIVFTSPFQFINLAISCGIASGLILTLPLILYQVLSFFKPALKIKEFSMVVRSIPVSLILFLAGFLFGFFIMKWQIEIFLSKSISLGIGNILDISRLLSTVLLTSVLMGFAFQFPIVLLILLRLGIINNRQLSKQRKWIYTAAIFFVIFLPADSILADVLLALPIIGLFEAILILNLLMSKKGNTKKVATT